MNENPLNSLILPILIRPILIQVMKNSEILDFLNKLIYFLILIHGTSLRKEM